MRFSPDGLWGAVILQQKWPNLTLVTLQNDGTPPDEKRTGAGEKPLLVAMV